MAPRTPPAWMDAAALILSHWIGRLRPETSARAVAALGEIGFVLGLRRRDAARTMAGLLGKRPGWYRRAVARQAYHTLGASSMEIWTSGPASFAKADCGTPQMLELVTQRYGQRGIVIAVPHLGHWDIGACVLNVTDATGGMLCAAKQQRMPRLDAHLNACRERAGMRIALLRRERNDVMVKVIRALRQGGTVGLLADQRPRGGVGCPGRFLGRDTSIHLGPAMAAKRTGCPIVPVACVRRSSSHSQGYLGRPILPSEGTVEELAQRYTDALTRFIGLVPGQYMWHHKRFKRDT
jgi:lauroyl/myristoyl acyltransferase